MMYKHILISVVLVIGVVVPNRFLYSQVQSSKSLTVGNKFIYVRVVGQESKGFYEQVTRDTIVNEHRYAVVFSSFDNSTRLERSDEHAIYILDGTGKEHVALWLTTKLRAGEPLGGLAMYGIGAEGASYIITTVYPPRKTFDTTFAFGAVLRATTPPASSSSVSLNMFYSINYASMFGLLDWQAGAPGTSAKNRNAVGLIGAIVNGKVYGDTTILPTLPKPVVSSNSDQNRFNPRDGVSFQAGQVAIGTGNRRAAPSVITTNGMTFTYTAPRDNNSTKILIFNEQGSQFIASVTEKNRAKGTHILSWNGKTYNGQEVKTGNYLALLVMNDIEVGRLVVTK